MEVREDREVDRVAELGVADLLDAIGIGIEDDDIDDGQ